MYSVNNDLKFPYQNASLCDRCGRRDGMDAAVTNEQWEIISGRSDGGGYLCLWCMDEIACEKGITFVAELYWVGKAGSSAGYGERDEEVKTLANLLEHYQRLATMNGNKEAYYQGYYDAEKTMLESSK